LASSLVLHGLMLAFILFAMTKSSGPVLQATPKEPINVIFHVQIAAGSGGGGGGSPRPAPRRLITARPAERVVIQPVVAPTLVPFPTLSAPIADMSDVLQTSGAFALAQWGGGGGGHGTGSGSGDGPGIGPGRGGGIGGGTGGGIGDGVGPGGGITDPVPLHEQRPDYTPDAIRMKLQGVVDLDVTVLPNGTVDARTIAVTRSLDARFGLDQRAVEAAKQWIFKPAMMLGTGVPVAVRVKIEMTFAIR
jgi:protein TonB